MSSFVPIQEHHHRRCKYHHHQNVTITIIIIIVFFIIIATILGFTLFLGSYAKVLSVLPERYDLNSESVALTFFSTNRPRLQDFHRLKETGERERFEINH